MKKMGIIGVGSMGSALTSVICDVLEPKEVIIFDTVPAKAQAMTDSTGCCVAATMQEVVEASEIILLCIKPQIVDTVLKDLMPLFQAHYSKGERQLLASVAAAWPLADLSAIFQSADIDMPVIRIMPNIPVRVGQGVLLFSNNEFASDADVDDLMKIFAKGGLCEHTPEDLMPVACPVFSCSPAMVYMFIESIADGGVQIGMERDQATRFAAQAVLGSAAMVLDGKKHIGQLKDELSTPGGMTIGGTNLMETMGFRGATIQGIVRAYERQFEMPK